MALFKIILLSFLFLPISLSVFAKSYSLKEVAQIYKKKSLAIESFQEMRQASVEEFKEQRASFFPSIELNYNHVNSEVPDSFFGGQWPKDQYQLTLDAEQPIYLGGRVWQGYKIAELNKDMAKWKEKRLSQDSLESVIVLALNVMALEEQKKALLKSQEVQKGFLKITQRKAKRGAAKSYELSQARAEYLSYQPRIEQTNQSLLKAKKMLTTELQIQDEEVVLEIAEPKKRVVTSVEEDKKRLISANPEFLEAQLAVNMAERQKKLDVGEDLPSLYLQGKTGYQSLVQSDLVDSDSKYHQLTFVVSVPLFSGLSSVYKRRKGNSNIASAERNFRLKRDHLFSDLKVAGKQLDMAYDRYVQSKEWEKQANRALVQATKSFKVGVVTNTEVVQMQRSWEAAHGSKTQALVDYYRSKMKWQKLRGIPVEENL